MEKLSRNKYNDVIASMVAQCHRDIVSIMRENHISKIMFYQHKDVLQEGIPSVVFNNDDFKTALKDLSEVTLCQDNNLLYLSDDYKWSGYTDSYFGDHFDAGHSLPRIYAAICDIINANDIKPNEMA